MKRLVKRKSFNARLIQQIFFALIIFSSCSYSALANLGPADLSTPKKQSPLKNTFDVWCVSKYKNCVVQLRDGRLSVDKSSGISSSQLVQWSRSDKYKYPSGLFNFIGPHHLYTYIFIYKTEDGDISEARLVFQNSKYSDKFYDLMKNWAPSKEKRCRYNFDLRKVVCD